MDESHLASGQNLRRAAPKAWPQLGQAASVGALADMRFRWGGDNVRDPWPGYVVGGGHSATDWQDIEPDARTNEGY